MRPLSQETLVETTLTYRIPLLNDHHTHPLLYAAFMDGVDLGRESPDSREEAVRRIRDHASDGEGWSIVHGWNSGRYPLAKADFDDLPPLVIFNLSLHGIILNEAGRARMRRLDPLIADNFDDDAWTERNLMRVLNRFAAGGASPERLQRFYGDLLAKHGIYRAEEMLLVDEPEMRLFDEAGLTGRTQFWAPPDLYESLPRSLQERVQGIKLFSDGAFGVRTAALHAPYQQTDHSGLLIYEPGQLEELIRRYGSLGKPIAIHAIGDRAIDQVVTAVETAGVVNGGLRMEHAQLISESTARRAKALGITLCMQPNFSDDSIHYSERLPEGYPERNNPFRMLIDRVGYVPGRDLLFGSDGMPHGVEEGLRQSLFPRFAGQVLTIEEFMSGYCLPDSDAGHIEVQVDEASHRVACRVRLAQTGGVK